MNTDRDRWKSFIDQCKSYDSRIEKMAKYIEPNSIVLDIGAGAMKLSEYLPEGCTYFACDIVKTSDKTLVMDLNDDFELVGQWDVCFCSGVLEYVNDLPSALNKLKNHFRYMLISYCFVDDQPERAEKYGFHNVFSYDEFKSMLESVGLEILEEDQWTVRHKIFYLKVKQ